MGTAKARLCLVLVGTALIGLSVRCDAKLDPNTCVGLWLFDENRGDEAQDESPNGLNGKLVGDVDWAPGKFDTGLTFKNGTYVDMGANTTLDIGASNASISVWFRYDGVPPDWHAVLVHKAVFAAPRHGYILCVRGNLDAGNVGKPLWWMGLGTNDGIHLFGASRINDGKWHHLVGTADRKGMMRLYRDGALDSEMNILDKQKENEDNASTFNVGGERNSRTLSDGAIDEVALFKTALAPEDVALIYERGLAGALGFRAVSPVSSAATAWGRLKTTPFAR